MSSHKESAAVSSTLAADTDASKTREMALDGVSPVRGSAEVLAAGSNSPGGRSVNVDAHPRRKRDRFRYLMTKDFWMVLLLGQILALCLTGTNTLTTLLVIEGTSIPAFQTFFNYVLLNIIYTSFTIYKYGLKGWAQFIWKDGWKCECSFAPVLLLEGRSVHYTLTRYLLFLVSFFAQHEISSLPDDAFVDTVTPSQILSSRFST